MSDVTPYDLLQPRSDFAMRNRYLSRIGAKVYSCLVLCRVGRPKSQ